MRAGGRASRGLPTHRQRPDTVFGVIFVTLEDETGWANVVVRSRVAGRYRCPFPGVRLLGVEGVVEREGEVVHLVARGLSDESALLGRLSARSRDFC